MTSKIALSAAAALLALTSVASASGVSFTDSQNDLQLRAQAERVAPSAQAVVTNPVLDPAYSQRDLRLQAQADRGTGTILTTHGNAVVAIPAAPQGHDFALGRN